ncbi:MAG: hypothetical protein PPP58_06110 [Natronomonas sp.]
MADDDPTFSIENPPVRRFHRHGGVDHEGKTVFVLHPTETVVDLADRVEAVLSDGPYRYGDWFDLPMPLYLVHDDDTGDTFRVAVRDGTVEFHALPDTDSAGLRALYRRIDGATDAGWRVERHDG